MVSGHALLGSGLSERSPPYSGGNPSGLQSHAADFGAARPLDLEFDIVFPLKTSFWGRLRFEAFMGFGL